MLHAEGVMTSTPPVSGARVWLFRLHVSLFVAATCLGALGVGGHRWAFMAGAAAALVSGGCAVGGGRTFLTSQPTRLSIAARKEDPEDQAAAERAAASWAGVVLMAFGGVVLYLTTR